MDYFTKKFLEVLKTQRLEILGFNDILEIKVERADGSVEYYRKAGNQEDEDRGGTGFNSAKEQDIE